ncbi:carbohydrate porin [Caulobacter sp. UNC358MFTsu5.1]|uniref:carbohydrate porin n=1 Tax=Caulobacter sp. UNC358MFTsu5.1 TaxID=1449049 RepID=UPI001E3D0FCF|nr:carbohydrate porin [Caulobacter sp. UNC358MFTsu5.1]
MAASSAALAQTEAGQGAWTHEVTYTADVAGTVRGGTAHAGRALDNLDVIVDGDLEKLIGWRGATVHGYLLNNSGGAPNDLAGTLQGIDNIEVARPRARLYELWVQSKFAGDHGSVLAGLYDLNSEFYSTEASGLLLAPPFGIGSEFASTGPNGPSIFPSTALAVRARIEGGKGAYLQAAALNAHAGTVGDPDGPSTSFDNGALIIAEAAFGDSWRLAAGGWFYTERQADLRALDVNGDPALSKARGGYVLAEYPFVDGGESGRSVRGFARLGFSDGDTTPFSSGWQAGVLVERVFASRPDSAFSIGMEQGRLSSKQRANTLDAGVTPADAESSVEITYSDKVSPRVALQPDLQFIRRAGGDRDAETVVVAALRLTINLF